MLDDKYLENLFNTIIIIDAIYFVIIFLTIFMDRWKIMKQVGFSGMSNIPLYETECKKCHKKFNTSTRREYCLDCKPFPIACD